MSAVEYQPDQAGETRRLLYSQDRHRVRLNALVAAYGAAFQLAEDTLYSIRENSRLPYATGDALDQWGALVGEARLGLDDNVYRGFISARIVANRSDGSLPSLAQVLALITDPLEIRGYELYPSLVVLQILRGTFMEDEVKARVRRFMGRIKPGGRALEVVEALAPAFGVTGSSPSVTPWISPSAYSVGHYSRLVYP